ncbi:MAG: hypothetical protein WC943_02880, partial [Elusimicrobiota bacterium]
MTALAIALAALVSSVPGASASPGPESLAASAASGFGASLSALSSPGFSRSIRPSLPPEPPRPAWLRSEAEGPDFEEGEDRFLESLTLLAGTSLGRSLTEPLSSGRGVVVVRRQGMWVTDKDSEFTAGLDYLLQRDAGILAPIVAHELEHLVQVNGGISGDGVRGARELGAFFTQCRPWVELGAPVEDADWPRNG